MYKIINAIRKAGTREKFKAVHLHKHLLLANTLSSGCFMLLGEYFAQKLYSREKLDVEKMKHSTVIGLSQGPLHHYIYLWIERLLPGAKRITVLKKILVDQFIVSPIFISHFLYTAYFLEGKSLAEIHAIFKRKFPTIYVADWAVWPCAQFINFCYIPLNFRVMYVNAISFFYSTFLCYVKNNP